jgi:hypothetical protein
MRVSQNRLLDKFISLVMYKCGKSYVIPGPYAAFLKGAVTWGRGSNRYAVGIFGNLDSLTAILRHSDSDLL